MASLAWDNSCMVCFQANISFARRPLASWITCYSDFIVLT